MLVRVLIVDDEPLARARLQRLVLNLDDVEVVGLARNAREAIEMIDTLSPNLIFMDIQMPGMNGLDATAEILAKDKYAGVIPTPAIVFCTAHDSHAIKAFELNASAYILKPSSASDVANAIAQASQLSQLQLAALQQQESYSRPALSIQRNGAIEKISIDAIDYFRAEGKYVVAGMSDGDEVFIDYTLKDLEVRFSDAFQRVHRSVIVNHHHTVRLLRDADGVTIVELQPTGKRFTVSRRLLSEVKNVFFS